MQRQRVVLYPCAYWLHHPRTGGSEHQVGEPCFIRGPGLVADRFLRIYAVAKKNMRIAIGFAFVTGSQLALGIYMLVLGIREGGKVKLLYQTNGSRSERLCSPGNPADTPGLIPRV